MATVELSPVFSVNLRMHTCKTTDAIARRSTGKTAENPGETDACPVETRTARRECPDDSKRGADGFSLEQGGFLGLATLRRRSRGRFQGPGFRPAFAGGVGVAFTAPAFARPLPTAPFFRMPWGMAGPGRPAALVGSGSPPPQPTTLARPSVRPAIPLRRDDLQRIHTP